MKIKVSVLLIFCFIGVTTKSFSESTKNLTPIEKSGFKETTSYSDVVTYIENLAGNYHILQVEVIGKSVQGRKIQMVHVLPAGNKKKLKVLIFSQQHGNEPAGKETALILLRKIAEGSEDHILDNIDLYLIPLVNPDGNEAGKRANANGEDINRDHLVLTQPEVLAIHQFYNRIEPDVTLDIHEYSAFRKEFRSAGYVRTDDEEFGAPTNPNISATVRDFALTQFFPFLKSELTKQGITFSNYYKMESPDDTVRASTNAIGDGRQSFAIRGSFSFILEGRSGRSMNDDLKRRVTRQVIAVEKFIEFVNAYSEEVESIVVNEKKRMQESNDKVAMQMDYVYDGSSISMPMQILNSGVDTVMQLPFAPNVKISAYVERPVGYFIPKSMGKVIGLLKLHDIPYITTKQTHKLSVEIYAIRDTKNVWMENKMFNLPSTEIRKEIITTEPGDVIVTSDKTEGLMLTIALEPSSMWGICQSDEFNFLCKKGSDYPIYRVTEHKGIDDGN